MRRAATSPDSTWCARAAAEAWNDPANFTLYDDVQPVLERLTGAGLVVGLVSNTHRELEPFLQCFELPVRFALSSRAHGRLVPCRLLARWMG